MAHPVHVITQALRLHTDGQTATEISQVLGVPRRTVADWLAGRRPRSTEGERCPDCGAPVHRFDRFPRRYAYLLGLYLGDGSLAAHRRGVYKLRITLDAAYPAIVSEAATAVETVVPGIVVGRYARPYGDVEVYAYSKGWPCLFPQHGAGPKHRRPIDLSDWQEEIVRRAPDLLLRGLIHSDGCRFFNTGRRGWRHPRYAFRNRSQGIRRIFSDACDLLSLHWTVSGDVVHVSRKDDVARLDGFIGPKR